MLPLPPFVVDLAIATYVWLNTHTMTLIVSAISCLVGWIIGFVAGHRAGYDVGHIDGAAHATRQSARMMRQLEDALNHSSREG